MIIDADTKPERQIYNIGAQVLKTLQEAPGNRSTVFDIFESANLSETVSIQTFFMVLDWLFLIGTIIDDSEGITLCS